MSNIALGLNTYYLPIDIGDFKYNLVYIIAA